MLYKRVQRDETLHALRVVVEDESRMLVASIAKYDSVNGYYVSFSGKSSYHCIHVVDSDSAIALLKAVIDL